MAAKTGNRERGNDLAGESMNSEGQVAADRVNTAQAGLARLEPHKKNRHKSPQWKASAQPKKGSPGSASTLYLSLDFLSVCVAGALAYQMRLLLLHSSLSVEALRQEQRAYLGFFVVYAILIVLVGQSQDLYRGTARVARQGESREILKGVFFATTLLIAFIYLSGVKTVSRLIVVLAGVFVCLVMMAWRLIREQRAEARVCAGKGVRNVLIVGAGSVGRELARQFEENTHWGLRVKGFVDQNGNGATHILGKPEDIDHLIRANFVEEVFITVPSQRNLVKSVAVEARKLRCHLRVVPDLYDGLGWFAPVEHLGKFPILELCGEPIPRSGLLIKRLMDVVLSSLALICCAPLFAIIAVAVRLNSAGDVLYRSVRVGRKGEKFNCLKFRTMVNGADKQKTLLRKQNERVGPFFKLKHDPRVTKLGRFLREYSLDELPQFWNVLRGDMSLVGPRPHPTEDFERYELEHYRRLDVKPGLTGLWQVTARHDPSFEVNMNLDLEYIERWNLWLDIKILLRTLPVMLSTKGW